MAAPAPTPAPAAAPAPAPAADTDALEQRLSDLAQEKNALIAQVRHYQGVLTETVSGWLSLTVPSVSAAPRCLGARGFNVVGFENWCTLG